MHMTRQNSLPDVPLLGSEAPVNVLIVDDEAKNLTVLEAILDGSGYQLVRAESAEQALLALLADEFALAILDIRMPGMTGFELAAIMKTRQKSANVPIIFLTAYYDEAEYSTRSYDIGAVDYLSKPPNPAALRSKVAVFAELYRERSELERVNRTFAAVVQCSDDGIISKDLNAIIATFNPGAERLFGYKAEEVVGKPVTILVPPDRENEEQEILARIRGGERVDHYETVRRRKDGTLIDISLTVSPVIDGQGRIVGASKIARNITERKAAQARLRESEERLRFIGESAQIGYWCWEIAADRADCSPFCKQLLGFPPEEPVSYARFLGALDLEDRERTDRAVRGCLEGGDRTEYDVEFRTPRRPDGTARWIQAKGSAVFADGKPVRMAGIVLDITARKEAEERLRRQADLLDQSQDAVLTWRVGGGIVYWNKGAERLYGYSAEEAVGRISRDLLQTQSAKPMDEVEAQIEREGSWYGELTHTARDGRLVPVESRQVRVEYSGETYVLETNRDVTERKAHEEYVHLLTREVNHRAKNMLSVVGAIARQTATKNPEDFLGRFSERMQALSAGQDLLIRNEWKGVEIGDLVRAQLAHFADLLETRIALRGPSLHLKAESAQAIGLALHELATNAGKYGALSTDKGRVEIRWQATSEHFIMSWTENEGPPVVPPTRSGFGTTVIQTMVKQSLDCEVAIDHARSGLMWHLRCPVANALKPDARAQPEQG
jgi:PAS domain S-box-containing protein